MDNSISINYFTFIVLVLKKIYQTIYKSFTKKLSIIEDCSETFFSRSFSSIIFIMKNNVEAYKIDNHYTFI